MSRRPTIVTLHPVNNAKDVRASEKIQVAFNTNLDPDYIKDFVQLVEGTYPERVDVKNKIVEGRAIYKNKTISFMPLQPLKKGTKYVFTLVGDSILDDNRIEGIRSITGYTLMGEHRLQFTTELGEELDPPKIVFPTHGTVIHESPVFTWQPVDLAIGYEIQISKTNTFAQLMFPINDEETIIYETCTEDSVPYLQADVKFNDGIYYWRIRSVRRDDMDRGRWSRVLQFNLSTEQDGTIAEGDAVEEDPIYDYEYNDIELERVEAFPVNGSEQVGLNVKSIYFRVIGNVDPSQLDIDAIRLEGIHISEDEQEESHGLVSGRTTVVESDDGTTYIVFSPNRLHEEVIVPTD